MFRGDKCLNRSLTRCVLRHTTRMLGGARRPPPPDYLALACRALNEVIRIDQRLLPFMAEQREMLERWILDQEIEASLRKVYGPPDPSSPRPQHFALSPIDTPQLLKDERALAKTQALVALLQAKLGQNR